MELSICAPLVKKTPSINVPLNRNNVSNVALSTLFTIRSTTDGTGFTAICDECALSFVKLVLTVGFSIMTLPILERCGRAKSYCGLGISGYFKKAVVE